MSKKKIADSIIIRVGGGIREVWREPVEAADILERVSRDPGFEQAEDVHPFGAEPGALPKTGPDKVIN
jgi:hypothetical protein